MSFLLAAPNSWMVARTSFSNSSAGSGCGRKRFQNGDFLFFLGRQFRPPAFFKLLHRIAPLFHFLLHQRETSGVRQAFRLALDLRVAKGGFNMRSAERRSASLASMAALISWESRSCKLICLFRGFEVAQGVAHLGGLFVILVVDGVVQGALQFFAFGSGGVGRKFPASQFSTQLISPLCSSISSRPCSLGKIPGCGDAVPRFAGWRRHSLLRPGFRLAWPGYGSSTTAA